MAGSNFYEDAVTEVANWLPGIIKAAAADVRGGKAPPWTRELQGKELLNFYRDMPVEKKRQLFASLSPEEQEMLRGAYGAGGL